MSTTLRLPVEGELPSFEGATGWLNSQPLRTSALRGTPVLVQFWTFTCINWLRTLPYVRSWHEKYRADGLVVLGVHTPEFEVEHSLENVRRAAAELQIEYPIALDSDYRVWRAFGSCLRIWLSCGAKPMSSIRSASSSTRTSVSESLAVLRSR